MRHSSRMKSRITKIAKAHGLDLTKTEQHVSIENNPYMRLAIETIGRNCVSVAHCYTHQSGDAMVDPEVVFWMCPIDDEWYPIYSKGMFGGYGEQTVATLNADGTEWAKCAQRQQANLSAFSNKWATNLGRQGFA